MAKLGKETIVIHRDDDEKTMFVTFDLHANVRGEFYTTVNEELVSFLKKRNIWLSKNRRGREGFFIESTKDRLISKIRSTVEKAISRQLVKEEIIIRYSFQTSCSFGLTLDEKIVPNLSWFNDGELNMDKYWMHGSKPTHAADPYATGVLFYVKCFKKREYIYLDGTFKTDYILMSDHDFDKVDDSNYNLAYLSNLASISPPPYGDKKEIDYTEERARFFVEMFKGLCKLAYAIKGFSDPDELIKIAEKGENIFLPKK